MINYNVSEGFVDIGSLEAEKSPKFKKLPEQNFTDTFYFMVKSTFKLIKIIFVSQSS